MRKISKVASSLALVLSPLPFLPFLAAPGQASDGPAAAKPADAVPQAIEIEPVPAWIRERAIPEATKARVEQAQSGTAYLLTDEQYRTRADGHDDWFRTAAKVTNRSGLESAGQVTMTYDPSFENVSIVFIHLIRDGKIIDLTRETQFRTVEHEGDLDDGIVSGTLKKMGNLRDVRVGDIVDYATIVHARTTLWPGNAFYHFTQRYSDPLALRTLRLVWPDGMVPQYKSINSGIAFATRKTPDGTEWEWTTQDPPALQLEDDVPTTAFAWGQTDVSTMKDWAAVARWATALYKGDDSLPDDFAAELDAIAKASPAAADRLTAAARYVQDNIRYVGEELGEGSYVPRRPKTVLARGYGDCKDKAMLLAVALRRLGIDAVPALVSSRVGAALPDRLPSPLEFDHVIVRAVVDGHVLWIDATGTHRGGRGLAIVPSDLGFGLPIREGQTALEPITGYADHAGRVIVLERFFVDEAAETPLTLHVETHYTAARADAIRATLASQSPKTVADGNVKFYRDRFPGLIESKPLAFTDDRDANELAITENYTMPRAEFVSAKIPAKLITRAYVLKGALPDRQANPRVQPLVLTDDRHFEQTIELHVKDRVLDPLDDIEAKDGAITFSRRTTKLPDGLSMHYLLDTGTRDVVKPSEAEGIYVLSDKIKDESGIEFYLEKSGRPNPAPLGMDAAVYASIKADMEKVSALVQKNDQASKLEALSTLADAAAKVPHPSPAAGLIDGVKAAILSDLRRPQAALAAFQSATAQYDGNPEVFRLWIAYELDLGTAESVARAMERTRKVQPQIVAALDKKWVQSAFQKMQRLAPDKREPVRQDICVTLAQAGWQQEPRTAFGGNMLGCAIAAYSLRGDRAAVHAALAKDPPTDTLLTLAIDQRHQALWAEIDRTGADRFRRSLQREADRAGVAAAAAPKNYEAVTYRMQSLRALGRFQEALAAGKALATDKAQLEIGEGDAFWLVNEYASNLRALGRTDEAIAALDTVLALGIDRYPDLVSIAINRAEIVVVAGRYQSGLDSLNALEADHLDQLSAYGKMWIWANQVCALHALGRDDDAKIATAKLAAKPDDNWSAATAAAACRNDTTAIADMLITRLRGSDTRLAALGLFVQFDTPEGRTPLEQAMRQTMTKARAMPEVQAEFAKYGRVVRYAGTTQGWNEF